MTEWISVKDRLPDDGTKVLLYLDYGMIEASWYDSSYYMPFWNRVTHWMPLPEPPKEDEHESD